MSERGIILPLVSIIIVTVVVIMIALGVDSTRLKSTQAYVGLKVEEACAAAALELPITSRAVARATNSFLSPSPLDVAPGGAINLNGYASITGLRLIVPAAETAPGTGIPDPGFTGGPSLVSAFGSTDCQGSICSYAGDVTQASIANNYPGNFFQMPGGGYYAGSYLACELTADLNTLTSGTKTALAKVAYRARAAGPVLFDTSGNYWQRGLTIGIAPQVETYPNDSVWHDPRFQFSLLAGTSIDPLDPINPKTALTGARQEWSGSAAFPSVVFESSVALTQGSDQHKEALIHYYNPHQAVFNTLLQSIVARASRMFRDNTEILMVQPRPMSGNSQTPPVLIVERGEDLTEQVYELPYVNMQIRKSVFGGHGSPLNWLCPFNAQSACPPVGPGGAYVEAQAQSQMLISSQLRDAYFISNSANGGRDGVVTAEDISVQVSNYDTADFGSLPQMPSYNSGADPYWGFSAGETANAEQLMRILSPIELCPWTRTGLTTCDKPAVQQNVNLDPNGMRGDIRRFLRYVNGRATNGTAIPSPGFQNPATAAAPVGVVNAENNDPVVGSRSSQVLLVLSKRIGADTGFGSEFQRIRSEVLRLNNPSNNAPGRAITVVYIPTNQVDAQPAVVDHMRNAFLAPLSGTGANRLYVIAPSDYLDPDHLPSGIAECATEPPYSTAAGALEPLCFRNYWEKLLEPGPGNIEEIADSVWSRLVITESAL